MRILASFAFAAATFTAPALAGDAAELSILGFSPDGAIFAFEEFGVQDGSGFPYANRFYINTATDSFVAGTPIRVRIDDEAATTEAARSSARDQGQAVVKDATLQPGFTAGFNPITELSADPYRLAVNPRPVFPPIDAPLEFRIEEISLDQPANCHDLGTAVGFRLVRVGLTPEQPAQLIHEDSTIPESRNCPLGYRLGAVQTFYPKDGPPVYAVMVSVRSVGFEGPNHRWIAIPGQF